MKMDGMAKVSAVLVNDTLFIRLMPLNENPQLTTTLTNSALVGDVTLRYARMRRFVPMDLSAFLSAERGRAALISGHHSIDSILGCLLDHPKHVFSTDKSILKDLLR